MKQLVTAPGQVGCGYLAGLDSLNEVLECVDTFKLSTPHTVILFLATTPLYSLHYLTTASHLHILLLDFQYYMLLFSSSLPHPSTLYLHSASSQHLTLQPYSHTARHFTSLSSSQTLHLLTTIPARSLCLITTPRLDFTVIVN
ncbi:hypothetical protein E2C01_088248 [Portunus trituberculatus]|uniref:Uncharacterized protein n=1 Tax=Portunus trituberculatus TaxID=210409 RepID=A0A5B7JG44_PORTR|nr:hypothetical protein [Portunus trituberculatus]